MFGYEFFDQEEWSRCGVESYHYLFDDYKDFGGDKNGALARVSVSYELS